jgi:hypothetical protein
MLDEQTRHLSDEQTRAILCENVANLYQIDLDELGWESAA